MGALNQMNLIIPNLAKICAPLQPLLSQNNKWKWGEEQERAFQTKKKKIKQITEVEQFNKNQHLRIFSDASKEELGAVLQQKTEEGWQATHFASKFLTPFEQKHSINELELLAVLWATEKFRNYVYGIQFEVDSDHKALTSTLKGNRSNKTHTIS